MADAHSLDARGLVLFDELRWVRTYALSDCQRLDALLARVSALGLVERSVFEFVFGATRTWLRAHQMRGSEHPRVKERCPFCMSFLPQGPVR
jgi:hypothetical protein